MTAFNIVRFRVRPEFEKDFVEAHRNMQGTFPGARRFSLIKTGDGAYCIVGEWNNFDSIVAARPNMLASLENIRDMLMDFGMGMGVTDPVSGEAVIDMWAGVKRGRKAKAKSARKAKAKAKKGAKKKAKKKARRR
jgi:hypothetical protein